MKKELWKPVKEFEGLYSVSNLGNVKRLARTADDGQGRMRKLQDKIMTPDDFGRVVLYKHKEYFKVFVRSLVAEAFLHVSYGKSVTHINGDILDNRAENLIATIEFRRMDPDWKDIPEYEGLYQASRYGQIRSLDRYVESQGGLKFIHGTVRSQTIDENGYCQVSLYKDGKGFTTNAHIFVAQAWIPNPEGKLTVNHIDGNKHNNNIENLEWATYGEQQEHAVRIGLRKKSYWTPEQGPIGGKSNEERSVRVRCIETGVEYVSYSEAGRASGTSASEVKRSVDNHVICGGKHYVKADEPDYKIEISDLKDEVWYDIPGYEGYYQISNRDRVKSLARKVTYAGGRIRTNPEKILKGGGKDKTFAFNVEGKLKQYRLNTIKKMTFSKPSKLFKID